MIVTLTPDPTLERTLEVRRLVGGRRQTVNSSRVEAGGKGLAVSRALARNGVPTTAVLPAGGPTGAELTALLTASAVPTGVVPTSGATRTQTTVVEADGTATTLCESGPPLTWPDVHALVSTAARSLGAEPTGADWVAVCGSLPSDVPAEVYAIIADAAHARDASFAVDVTGSGLRDALAAGPDLVRTDVEGLVGYTGHGLDGLADVIIAAGRLRDAGAGAVLTRLGETGAVLVDETGAHFGSARGPYPLSRPGTGEAMFAGFLAHCDHTREDWAEKALAAALAWGVAASRRTDGAMPGPGDIDLTAVVSPSTEQNHPTPRAG